MAIDPKKLATFAKAEAGESPEHEEAETPEEEEAEHAEGGEEDDKALVDEALAEIAETGGEEEVMGFAAGYDPEVDGNPPAWVEDEDIWERAKTAVDPEGDGAEYEDVWAVVATVYKKMGGAFKAE